MVRRLVLVLGAFLVPGLAWSLELQGEAGLGLVWGRANEMVLRAQTYDDPVSLLEWDIPPTAKVVLGVTARWSPLTATRLRLDVGVPLSWGTMVDQDWRTGGWDHARSTHTSVLNFHGSIDVAQSVYGGPWSAGVGLTYRAMSWEAWNGSGTYVSTQGVSTDYTFSGLGIAYRQQWVVPYFEVGWTSPDSPGWQFAPSLQIGPFSYGQALDNHFLKDQTYLDTVWGGFSAKVSADLLAPAEWGLWGLRTFTQVHWGARGDTLMSAPKSSTAGVSYESTKASNPSGAWFWESGLTVFVRN